MLERLYSVVSVLGRSFARSLAARPVNRPPGRENGVKLHREFARPRAKHSELPNLLKAAKTGQFAALSSTVDGEQASILGALGENSA